MMAGSLLVTLLALGVGTGATAADPCVGVLDRTASCQSPDDATAPLPPDPPAAPAAQAALSLGDVIASEQIPPKLGLIAAALAMGGTAAMSVTWAVTPPDETDEQRQLRLAMRVGGATVLASSALVGGAAVTLALFDPSTGRPRVTLVEGDE